MSPDATRATLLTACLVAIYVLSGGQRLSADPSEAWNVSSTTPARPAPPAAEARLMEWRILENPNGPHTALFFDPTRQVFAVYHVDSGTGEIKLKSVRPLSADLQLPHHNSSNPTPRDVQAMLREAG